MKENGGKLYYPINEVAKIFKQEISTIRYWDTEFDILKPKKNKKGDRFFTEEDLDNINKIIFLKEKKGMTLNGIKKLFKEKKKELDHNMEIIKKLNEIKSILVGVRNELCV